MAVLEGHVVPTVPYISDAATYSPESCIFGQLINIGSVLCKFFPPSNLSVCGIKNLKCGMSHGVIIYLNYIFCLPLLFQWA